MKVNSESLTRHPVDAPKKPGDLLGILKRLDSLPARVVTNADGQLLLATSIGNIKPTAPLPLQPGQQVLLRLDPATGQPTVSPVRSAPPGLHLPIDTHQGLAKLLNAGQASLAKVVNQSTASTQVTFNGNQVALPKIPGADQGQLLSIRLNAPENRIEIQVLEKKPLLKALLSQLVSRSQTGDSSSTAVRGTAPLVELFRHLGKAMSTNSPGELQQGARATTDLSATTNALSGKLNTVISSDRPGQSTSDPQRQVLSLLNLLPRLSAPQATVLSQWIAPFIQQKPYLAEGSNQGQLPSPLRLLQQVSNGDMSLSQLERSLNSLLPERSGTPNSQQAQGTSQDSRLLQEMQILQGKDAARLLDQVGHQTQTQRTSVSLQQEIQQPLVFMLSLPVSEGKQIRQLDIKVEQRNQAKEESKQAWDARLSFEFGAMGMVSCHIFLVNNQVSSNFYCDVDDTRQRIDAELTSFRQQLIKAGFKPGELNSYPAAQASLTPDPVQISESILDITV